MDEAGAVGQGATFLAKEMDPRHGYVQRELTLIPSCASRLAFPERIE